MSILDDVEAKVEAAVESEIATVVLPWLATKVAPELKADLQAAIAKGTAELEALKAKVDASGNKIEIAVVDFVASIVGL
jgi:hypothetical protein